MNGHGHGRAEENGERARRTSAYVYNPSEEEHDLPGHPESHRRIVAINQVLQRDGILERFLSVEATPIALERLTLVHTSAHVRRVEFYANRGGGYIDSDTYTQPCSYQAALDAAGGVVNLVEAVLSGRVRNGFALIRPPGHHAGPQQAEGFCLFNNIAIAARVAQREWQLDRILIVDFDVHHGNGTQEVFYDDPGVLYFSTHQSPLYPGTGHWREIGVGAGQGFTVNVPFPPGVGDEGYRRAFDEVLLPIAERYRPQLILVSAGYDGHWADPLAGMRLSIAGYATIVRRLLDLAALWCQGRIVMVLEGGYHLEALAHGVLTTLRLLEDPQAPASDPLGSSPYPERPVDDLLRAVREIHRLS